MCNTTHLLYKLSNKYKVTLELCLRLSPEYQRLKVDSARWHNWDERARQNHIMKFRQFKPSFSDEFERRSNAGHKPNFTPRSRVIEAQQVLVDRQRDQRDEGIRLKISKSPESNTWRLAEAQNQGESSMRFADPDMNLKKRLELRLRKDVPRLVHLCQGNRGKQITEDCFLVMKSFGTSRWTDKNGNERSKFGPMYLHFEKNCLQNFDSENHHRLSQSFDYSRITVDQKCKDQLSEAENIFLIGLGLNFQ